MTSSHEIRAFGAALGLHALALGAALSFVAGHSPRLAEEAALQVSLVTERMEAARAAAPVLPPPPAVQKPSSKPAPPEPISRPALSSVTTPAPSSQAASSAPVQEASAAVAQATAPVRVSATVGASYVATETEKWYPAISRRYEEQGTVLLRILVSASGKAEKVEFKKRSDYPLLNDAAAGLASSLKYNPTRVDGTPVDDWLDLPVVFRLRNS